MENYLSRIILELKDIKIKLSMNDSITQIRNARFWLPNYPVDCIQKCIVNFNDYWDRAALNIIDKYLSDSSVILDIGANIGSHSVYWAIERNAKKIYSFEPLKSTYDVLKRNINLNNLNRIVVPYNVGLYNKRINAAVSHYNLQNIGNTSFIPKENGRFKLVSLDSMNFPEKIDLIKIDVEGLEVEVLQGGIETIKKHKPVIVIETFKHKQEVDEFFDSLGYSLTETIREGEDYIYRYSND